MSIAMNPEAFTAAQYTVQHAHERGGYMDQAAQCFFLLLANFDLKT
jgi:hypothetical protein